MFLRPLPVLLLILNPGPCLLHIGEVDGGGFPKVEGDKRFDLSFAFGHGRLLSGNEYG